MWKYKTLLLWSYTVSFSTSWERELVNFVTMLLTDLMITGGWAEYFSLITFFGRLAEWTFFALSLSLNCSTCFPWLMIWVLVLVSPLERSQPKHHAHLPPLLLLFDISGKQLSSMEYLQKIWHSINIPGSLSFAVLDHLTATKEEGSASTALATAAALVHTKE